MDQPSSQEQHVQDGVRRILTDAPPEGPMALVGPQAAIAQYRDACARLGMQMNSTFVKAITSGSGKIDFTNSYFGERGLAPILSTLRNIPFFEVSFKDCQLTADDIKRLQATFVSHPTATSLDLRGTIISMTSARRLLSLAIQNNRITSILVEDDTPKAILIKRQCLSNANVAVHASKCVVCQKSMIHSTVDNNEARLILNVTDLFDDVSAMRISAMEFETLLRSILATADLNDGVLFLCSQDCTQSLARDLVTSMQCVTHEVVLKMKHVHPHNAIITRCCIEMIEKASQLYSAAENEHLFVVGTDDDSEGLQQTQQHLGLDELQEDLLLVSAQQKKPSLADKWKSCAICGDECFPLRNAEAHALNILRRDLTNTKVVLRPSSFIRLLHLLLRFCSQPACSRKCVRSLVRFGIHGLGGVHIPKSNAADQSVTSIGVPLIDLPLKDFAVFRFDEVISMFHHGEEDTTCAVTLASLMTDIEGTPIDPYMIFALGRSLGHQSPHTLGMQLRSACQAVMIGGCLTQDQAPFRVHSRPDRAAYADWNKWSALPNIEKIKMISFARRRRAVYVVDGLHGNVFDNVRAALWAFRGQRRACVTVIKFCAEWLQIESGIITAERGQKGGILTSVKIVGQCCLNSTFFLIIQPNFGKHFGNKGYFYISKSTFNRYCRGLPYIFLDFNASKSNEGQYEPIYRELVSPNIAYILEAPSETLDVLMLLAMPKARQVDVSRFDVLAPLLASAPPSLNFLFASIDTFHQSLASNSAYLRRHLLDLYTMGSGDSQIAFVWGELLGSAAVNWVCRAIQAMRSSTLRRRSSQGLAIRHFQRLKSVQPIIDDEEWAAVGEESPLEPATGAFVAVSPAEVKLTTPVLAPQPPSLNIVPPSPGSAFRALALMAATEEATHVAQRKSFMRSTPNTWNPILLSPEFSQEIISGTDVEAVNPDLIGRQWQCVAEPTRGSHGTVLLFFIGHLMCRYDCERSRLISPLRPIAEDSRMARFPFASGFDAVVAPKAAAGSSVASHVYFFSGRHWIVWDALRDACVTGPHNISVHRQFRALPRYFHEHAINLVMSLPHRSTLLFFSRDKYVEYDLQNAVPLTTEPLDLADPAGPFSTAAALCGKLPVAALQWEYLYQWPPEGSSIIVFKDMSCLVMARDGTVSEPQTILDLGGRLRQLPRVFLQNTSAAWSDVLSAVLSQVPRNKLCHIELFQDSVKPPACLGIAPSTPVPGLSVSWEVRVSSSLATVDDTVSLSTLIKDLAGGEQDSEEPNILSHLTVLRKSIVPADMQPPQHDVISFDFGDVNDARFAYVCIALDLSGFDEQKLVTHPIAVAVECSWDGYSFTSVAQHSISCAFSGVYWAPQHTFRYWRLVFQNQLPVGVGVIRVLWYTAQWVTDSTLYEFASHCVPSEDALVVIEADTLLSDPAELLSDISSQGVFSVPANDHWVPKQAVLPLLPEGNSCLFFAGASFVEFSLVDRAVIGNRSVSMARHPAFSALPFPFNSGFNAVVYPNTAQPYHVVLFHGKLVLEWDLEQGKPIGNTSTIAASPLFKGIPKLLEQGVEAAYNEWDSIGVVVLIAGDRYVRWNMLKCTVIEGPSRREKLEVFRGDDVATRTTITAAFLDPSGSGTFFLFSGSNVQERPAGVNTQFTQPVSVDLSSRFHNISFYLPWGTPRGNSIIKIDLRDRPELVIGVTLRSSDASNPHTQWRVECSDDGVTWAQVAIHVQSVPKSVSFWSLEAVGGVSHRFWMLTSIEGTTRAEQPIVYSQLLLNVLPSDPLSVRPERVSHSGSISGSLTSFLAGTAVMELPQASRGTFNTITFDYGAASWPELSSVSLSTSSGRVADVWAVLFSDNGQHWTSCGVWRVHMPAFRLAWKPSCPHRFWRFEQRVSTRPTTLTLGCVEEYSGPSVVIPHVSLSRALELLFPSTDAMSKLSAPVKSSDHNALVHFEPVVGRTISIDFKGSPQSIISAAIFTSVDSRAFTTVFDVEYSSDAVTWYFVGSIISCDEVGTASWESEGAHRYWRLRVKKHHGARYLFIRRVELALSGLILYDTHKRHLLQSDGGEFRVKEQRMSFVAIRGTFPPNSAFVIEKQGAEEHEWVPVAICVNNENTNRKKFVGWPLSGSSTVWRIRSLEGISEGEPVAHTTEARTATPAPSLSWLSFSGTKMEPVEVAPEHGPVAGAAGGEITLLPEEVGMPALTWTFPAPLRLCRVDVTSSQVGAIRSSPDHLAAAEPHTIRTTPQPPPLPTRIIVETSADGSLFVPIASVEPSSRAAAATVVVLIGSEVLPRRHWRIRFSNWACPVEDCHVKWFTMYGSASMFHSEIRSNLSNSMSAVFDKAVYSFVPQLISLQDAALQQANSVATGIRQAADLSSAGAVATEVQSLQKLLQKHMTRQVKESSSNQTGVDLTAILDNLSTLSPDIVLISRLMFGEGAPRTFLAELKLVKDSSASWYFPKSEYRGTIGDKSSIFGFSTIPLTLSFRFNFSDLALHQQKPNIAAGGAFSQEILTPFVMINTVKAAWTCSKNFPNQSYILQELGMTERQVLITIAARNLDCTPTFSLAQAGTPAGLCVASQYPFTLPRGISVLAQLKLEKLPWSVLGKLRTLVSAAAFSTMKTQSVLAIVNFASWQSTEVSLRFTVPTESSLSISGLLVSVVDVHVLWRGQCDAAVVSFVSRQATWSVDGTTFPIAISGTFSVDRPTLSLVGHCSSAVWSEPLGLVGTVLEGARWAAECMLEEGGDVTPPTLQVHGVLCFPSNATLTVPCSISLAPPESNRLSMSSLTIQLLDATFYKLVELANVIIRRELPLEPWMVDVPFSVSTSLRVFPQLLCAKGSGSASFCCQSGSASVAITPSGAQVFFKLQSLRLGSLTIEGWASTGGMVPVEARSVTGFPPTIRLDGVCRTISETPAIAKVELSRHGTLLIANGSFFELCMRDPLHAPILPSAVATLSKQAFSSALSKAVQFAPLTRTLVSAGMPFCFSLQNVTAEPVFFHRKALLMTFSGVFFGCRFDLGVNLCFPGDEPDALVALCDIVTKHIMEQCSDSLWSALDAFIGLEKDDDDSPSASHCHSAPFSMSGTVDCDSCHVRRSGLQCAGDHLTFLSRWVLRECEEMDDVMGDALEPAQ